MATITTPVTEMLGFKYPVILAGMGSVAGPNLAAAVTNAGGLGVVGGVFWTPKMMRKNIVLLKEKLHDKNAPFGVDLLFPQVGGNARKTNHDYTKGNLPELVDVMIEEGAKLLVSAVGIPPKWAVEKLHAHGIPVMNMIGKPKHVKKALGAGVDIICAQGGEGGGHTGDVPTSVLIPSVVDLCKGKKSPLTGGPIHVVAAGGIYDGRGLAMALSLGASAVWVGTRFVAATESGAAKRHKTAIVKAGFHDTIRTPAFSGRPLRILKTDYAVQWETTRAEEQRKLREKGILPIEYDVEQIEKAGEEISMKQRLEMHPLLMGVNAGAINDVKPAKQIIEEMVGDAIQMIQNNYRSISKL